MEIEIIILIPTMVLVQVMEQTPGPMVNMELEQIH